jgi:hypothetical protein
VVDNSIHIDHVTITGVEDIASLAEKLRGEVLRRTANQGVPSFFGSAG